MKSNLKVIVIIIVLSILSLTACMGTRTEITEELTEEKTEKPPLEEVDQNDKEEKQVEEPEEEIIELSEYLDLPVKEFMEQTEFDKALGLEYGKGVEGDYYGCNDDSIAVYFEYSGEIYNFNIGKDTGNYRIYGINVGDNLEEAFRKLEKNGFTLVKHRKFEDIDLEYYVYQKGELFGKTMTLDKKGAKVKHICYSVEIY